MTRWNWKRWAFAIVTGTALTGTAALTSAADLPKAGETITLKFQGQADRIVTIVKATKKPDGSIETEVKDPKNGETFTLVDPAPESKVKVPAAVARTVPVPLPIAALPPLPKPVGIPEPVPARPAIPAPLPPVSAKSTAPVLPPVSAKPTPVSAKPYVPVLPPVVSKPVESVKAPMSSFAEAPSSPPRIVPPAPTEDPRDKKLIGGRLLNREPVATPRTPAAEASAPAAPQEEKKPGIIGRIFGKKPATTVMPATSLPTQPSAPRVGAEPPRVMTAKPVAPPAPGRVGTVTPPTPVIPSVPVPSSVPSVSAIPTPLPASKPTPLTVPIPTPTIPIPPTQSRLPVTTAVAVKPAETTATVRTASNTTPIEMGLPSEIQPQATTLRDALAPSHRMMAAKGLAEGRHGSSEAVKAVLFHSAKTDPCPAVKACCIEHLCTLGYFDPAFLKHLKAASDDASEEVRSAARAALVKMSPR